MLNRCLGLWKNRSPETSEIKIIVLIIIEILTLIWQAPGRERLGYLKWQERRNNNTLNLEYVYIEPQN